MSDLATMLAYALFLWWFSTGAILFANHLPPATFRWSFSAASIIAAAALFALARSSAHTTIAAAYWGFTSAVLLWGWHEMSFFMGVITGPRRTAGPPSQGWQRFWHATQTTLHHELAILLTALAIAALTWHQPNQVGTWTFLALWAMRQSAKINVFLGVRNLNEQFLPPRLLYLRAYLRKAPMNALLPFSIAGGLLATWHFAAKALQADATPFTAVGHGFIAAILALAVLEHAFMVIPLPFAALWNWSVRRPTYRTP